MFVVFNSDDLGFHPFTKGSVNLGNTVSVVACQVLQVLKESILVEIARALVVIIDFFWLQRAETVLPNLAQEETLLKERDFPE